MVIDKFLALFTLFASLCFERPLFSEYEEDFEDEEDDKEDNSKEKSDDESEEEVKEVKNEGPQGVIHGEVEEETHQRGKTV